MSAAGIYWTPHSVEITIRDRIGSLTMKGDCQVEMSHRILRTKQLTAGLIFAVGLVAPAKADFFVDDWVLSTTCMNPFGFPSAFHLEPQNPFNHPALAVSVHNSMATAAYAFNWGLATGQFQIDADLVSEGGDGGPFCGTDNQIEFHITQDTLLSFGGELTYQFNGGIRSAEIRLSVRDTISGELLLIRGDSADTVAGDPPTDTLHVSDSIVLASGSYRVRALMDLSAVGGSPNSISTAHGFANIQMTTVPSPAFLGPLALSALLIRRSVIRVS